MTIRQEPAAVKLENLPFTNEQRDQIESALHSGYGMIVCTGSHGSGKTTTQFALLQELNTPSRKLIAVEEPGGYTRADITQIRIRPQSGMGYAEMLRAVKRADPDVVLVGIIDSPQTAIECINLSGSGHLLIGSMQTADTVSTIEHLCDIGIEPYKICENVRIVVAQRLIRRLCPHCAESIDEPVNNSSYPQAQAALKECAIDWGCITKNWKKAVGCPHCRNLGYIGRKCIYEVLAPNKEFRAAIMQNASGEVLRQIAIGNGMLTLQAGAALLAANGEVSLTEAISVTGVM